MAIADTRLQPARLLRVVVCGLLLCATATLFAQARPEFEVASIRPAAETRNVAPVGVQITGSQLRIARMSLKDYIGMAYRVRLQQIAGPDWIAQDRFDISATIPAGLSRAEVPEMLQALLAERFHLQLHRETKEFPIYALTVTKGGIKVQPSAEGPASTDAASPVNITASGSGNGVAVDLGSGASFALGNNRLEVRKMTMASMADVLARFIDRPVVDATGVGGRFDLTLDLAPEDYVAMLVRTALNNGVVLPPQALRALDNASANPLSVPLQAFGLDLEPRKAPLDILVVDSALKTPTDN